MKATRFASVFLGAAFTFALASPGALAAAPTPQTNHMECTVKGGVIECCHKDPAGPRPCNKDKKKARTSTGTQQSPVTEGPSV